MSCASTILKEFIEHDKLIAMKYVDRITFNPNQCGGRPCIRNMRIRVKDVLDLLAAGEKILRGFHPVIVIVADETGIFPRLAQDRDFGAVGKGIDHKVAKRLRHIGWTRVARACELGLLHYHSNPSVIMTTLLPLPAYSPELNPAERLWLWLRSHQLSNRIYEDYDDLLRETDHAWLTLDAETIKSICACPWIERAIQA